MVYILSLLIPPSMFLVLIKLLYYNVWCFSHHYCDRCISTFSSIKLFAPPPASRDMVQDLPTKSPWFVINQIKGPFNFTFKTFLNIWTLTLHKASFKNWSSPKIDRDFYEDPKYNMIWIFHDAKITT